VLDLLGEFSVDSKLQLEAAVKQQREEAGQAADAQQVKGG
jgi:hypothetical protein